MTDYKKEIHRSEILGEEYTLYTHPEGLQIYILKKDTSTSFALFGTKYGSLHNCFYTGDGTLSEQPSGIAHFLEHKLFCCEDGSDAFERFSALGADANAYTSFNCTAYHFSCSENFYEALSCLADFVTHPYFTEQSVKKEVPIITEEIAMCDDNPYGRCFYGMLDAMYHKHSIKLGICGTAHSIRQISAERLYECYRAFYRPDNMIFVVCGAVDDTLVLKAIDDCLPDTFVRGTAAKINEGASEPPNVRLEYIEQNMPTAKPIFTIGFKQTDIPSDTAERQKMSAELGILCDMLFSSTSRLYEQLFESRMISPSLSYETNTTDSFCYTAVSGEADDPHAVLGAVKEQLAQVAENGLSREDFERAKRVMYGGIIRSFDSSESIGNEIFSLAIEDIDTFEDIDILCAVTYEDTVRRFEKFYKNMQVTLSVVKEKEV